jgi:hypothetical protein
MGIISGGNVMSPSPSAGLRSEIYAVEGVPTDANIGVPAANIINGMFATNVLTGFLYERRAGAWVRMDTV